MGCSPSSTRQWKPPRCWRRSKRACSSSPKKGVKSSPLVAQKLTRLQTIVAERAAWTDQLAQIKRLHGWLLEVEHLLDESLVPAGEVVSNVTVGNRLDSWRERMTAQLKESALSELERECLTEFLRVLSNLRPYLVQCYDRERSEEHTSELQSHLNLVCRLLLEKKKRYRCLDLQF